MLNNSHYYDGKWSKELMEIIRREGEFIDPNNFLRTISEIRECGGNSKVCDLLMNDRRNNVDMCNGVNMEILLQIVWKKSKKDTVYLPLFLEQFADILNGPCAQGRTTRIAQLLYF